MSKMSETKVSQKPRSFICSRKIQYVIYFEARWAGLMRVLTGSSRRRESTKVDFVELMFRECVERNVDCEPDERDESSDGSHYTGDKHMLGVGREG